MPPNTSLSVSRVQYSTVFEILPVIFSLPLLCRPERWCVRRRPIVWEVCVDSHRAHCLPHDGRRALNGWNPSNARPAGPPRDVPGAFLTFLLSGPEIKLSSFTDRWRSTFTSPFETLTKTGSVRSQITQRHWSRLKAICNVTVLYSLWDKGNWML